MTCLTTVSHQTRSSILQRWRQEITPALILLSILHVLKVTRTLLLFRHLLKLHGLPGLLQTKDMMVTCAGPITPGLRNLWRTAGSVAGLQATLISCIQAIAVLFALKGLRKEFRTMKK